MKDRALALAGLLQSIQCVDAVAADGSCEREAREAVLGSLFRLDAASPEAVFGHHSALNPGLRELLSHLESGRPNNGRMRRIAFSVLQVERRLAARLDLLNIIRTQLIDIDRQREHLGLSHSLVLERLGDLYANTVSKLSPRVLVQGNPAQLAQTAVVAQIRALLLAAVRSAVLWRQLGGSYWDLFLRRRAIANGARAWLRGTD